MTKKIFVLMLFLVYTATFATDLQFIKKHEIENIIIKLEVNENGTFVQTRDNILILSEDGEKKSSIGRVGEGPGEYKHLMDFTTSSDRVYILDFFGKIICFDLQGNMQKETKLKGFIDNVYRMNGKSYYTAKKSEKNDKNKLVNKILVKEAESGDVFAVYDDLSRINAKRPGKKVPSVPWFPAPFYNKIILIPNNNILYTFRTRCNNLLIKKKNKATVKVFDFELKPEKVTEEDKKNFFQRISGVNKKKLAPETKSSVVFPKTKPFFAGAISIGSDFGIITKNQLIRISNKGELIKRYNIPENDDFKLSESTDSPIERRMFFYNNVLYIGTSDGVILMYKEN
jgi:hypothetical protein